MTSSVPVHYQQRFHDEFIHLFQQKDSRVASFVRDDPDGLNGSAGYFDRLGAEEMQEVVGRNQQTPNTELDHTRRRITLRTYTLAPMRDRRDKVRMGRDPLPAYTEACLMAARRQKDRLVINAMAGNAYSMDEDLSASAIALPAAQKIAHGSAGLTYDKLVEARTKLATADVDPDLPKYLAIHGNQMGDLLDVAEAKSRDYIEHGGSVVRDGVVEKIAGFMVIETNLLGVDGSSNRLNYAWVRPAVGLAIGEEINTDLFVRRDRNSAWQAQVWMDMDATRIIDEGVVEIANTET